MNLRNHLVPLTALSVLALVASIARVSTRPLLVRDWAPAYATPAVLFRHGDDVTIQNIRNTDHSGANGAPRFYDRSFRLADLRHAWLVVENTSFQQAHVLIDFEFQGQDYVTISPEPRLEKGERYSAIAAWFRQYEMTYVFASEFDQIRWRANVRGNRVCLYELGLSPEDMQALFASMIDHATELSQAPVFYHPWFNSAAGNVLRHLKPFAQKKSVGPLFLSAHMPDRVYAMGFMRQDAPLSYLEGRGFVSDAARAWRPGDDFSTAVHKTADGFSEGL